MLHANPDSVMQGAQNEHSSSILPHCAAADDSQGSILADYRLALQSQDDVPAQPNYQDEGLAAEQIALANAAFDATS